jgi:hypothetical protein
MKRIILVLSVLALFSCKKESLQKTQAEEIETVSLIISNLSYSSATYGAIQYTNEKGEFINYQMQQSETFKTFKIKKSTKVKFLGVQRVLNTSIGPKTMTVFFTVEYNGNTVKSGENYILNYELN